MSKNKQRNDPQPNKIEIKESRHTVQNARPDVQWQSFEQCWHTCVKNGTPLLMESCKAHLRAMGWLSKPEKWIEGMRHFGIPVEK
jgi:hypothetical protein